MQEPKFVYEVSRNGKRCGFFFMYYIENDEYEAQFATRGLSRFGSNFA